MIAKDFVYIRPDTAEEAAKLFFDYPGALYYGGGSEIITMCRAGAISPAAVIDLKGIPEASGLVLSDDHLAIGGCATLREIKDSGLFPLLGEICGRIADHSNQCRITLAGNICGSIIYRETVQALLIADAEAVLFGQAGERRLTLREIFDRKVKLEPGEFILKVLIPKKYLDMPFNHVKRTLAEKIDYPLISLSAINAPDGVRFAVSGLLPYPFRSVEMESALKNRAADKSERIKSVLALLPDTPVSDHQGGADYRLFVFQSMLSALMEAMDI